MTWTTNTPTMPGWYWWRCFAVMTGKQTKLEVVYIEEDGYCHIAGDYVSNLGGQWQGPLVPEEAP
jgi:hypothetical protein